MKKLGLCTLLLVSLLLSGCDLLERAAAVVSGDKITVKRVDEALAEYEKTDVFKRLAQQGNPSGFRREFEQTYLSILIRRAVLEPEATERGIEITDADVTAALAEIKAEFPSQSAFEEALREQNLTAAQLEELLYDQLLEDQLRAEITEGIGPDPQDVIDFYESNTGDYQETEVRHILVEEPELAGQIAAELKSTRPNRLKETFTRLAAEHSSDTSNAENGGKLGFFKAGDFVEPFEVAADELEVGEISDPVETEFGFHIIWVTDRRVQEFEDVREELEAQLAQGSQQEAWDEWVLERYRDADIDVNPRYGELDLESQQVVDPAAGSVPGAAIPSQAPAVEEGGD